MSEFEQTILPIPCSACGVLIQPNPSNLCINCIRKDVDITEGIPKQGSVVFCKSCGRYHVPPSSWQKCELESRELLSLLLKKIRGLNRVRLVDASFVWTEPHSRRLKVQLTIQKEVYTNTILQQSFVVEFVVHTNQCDNCAKAFAGDAIGWKAVVQVRQRVDHKRTFFFLEQQILKHNAHYQALNIKEMPEGMDLFFQSKSHATKFSDFVSQVCPVKVKESQKLVSHDESSNVYNYKYTLIVEIVPICREDLVFLPKKVAHHFGGINRLVLISRVMNIIHVMDPSTLQRAECNAAQFWKTPFSSFANRTHQTEFVVLDVEPLGRADSRFSLAEVTIARACDFGVNDDTTIAVTHLGHLLQAGDTAMGYDLRTINCNDASFGGSDAFDVKDLIPDVILVRKSYPRTAKRAAKRKWKLRKLDMEAMEAEETGKKGNKGAAMEAEEKKRSEYEGFLADIEEDPELRSGINVYKDMEKINREMEMQKAGMAPLASDDDDDEGEEVPEIALEELLDDLTIDDKNKN